MASWRNTSFINRQGKKHLPVVCTEHIDFSANTRPLRLSSSKTANTLKSKRFTSFSRFITAQQVVGKCLQTSRQLQELLACQLGTKQLVVSHPVLWTTLKQCVRDVTQEISKANLFWVMCSIGEADKGKEVKLRDKQENRARRKQEN